MDITSTKNERVRLAKNLQTKARVRRLEHKIVLEGTRLIRDAIERSRRADYVLYNPSQVDYDLLAQLQNQSVFSVSEDVLHYISDTQNPQGILGVFPLPIPPLPKSPRHITILDAVRDPGNMGTILRTAAAAGVDVVILSPGCTDPYNPKVLRSGMGAHFRIPIVEANWEEIETYCEAHTIYAATGGGTTHYTTVDWIRPWGLIIGSEAQGIGEQATNLTHELIYIPMANETESLNVSTAAAVILFEARRHRA